MRKRSLAVLLCLLLLVMLTVSGCGSKEKPASGDSPATTAEPKDTASELEQMMSKVKDLPGYSCEMTMSGADGKTLKSKLWGSGSRSRMEMEADGIKSVMLVNSKGEIWTYMPAENMAMKVSSPPEANLPTDWASTEDKPVISGSEKIDGYDCVILTFPSDSDTKCWVMKEHGLPVKMESVAEGKTTVVKYSNYNINKQPDDLFEVPAGAQVMTMP